MRCPVRPSGRQRAHRRDAHGSEVRHPGLPARRRGRALRTRAAPCDVRLHLRWRRQAGVPDRGVCRPPPRALHRPVRHEGWLLHRANPAGTATSTSCLDPPRSFTHRSAPCPPPPRHTHTHRVLCSNSCACLSNADLCLRSDAMPESRRHTHSFTLSLMRALSPSRSLSLSHSHSFTHSLVRATQFR